MKTIDCLEFKRLSLIDPRRHDVREDAAFLAHAKECVDCQGYLASVLKMDNGLRDSMAVEAPPELIARLKLNRELDTSTGLNWRMPRALAASVAAIAVSIGIAWVGLGSSGKAPGEDYQILIAAVMEHMHEVPTTPVWDSQQANTSVAASLASYDQSVSLKPLPNLQFGNICPMGQYRGLHAVLDTEDGQVTFAYIKGEPIGQLEDHSSEGHMIRVRPVFGGNIIVISRNQRGLELADSQLSDALYWDI